MSFGSGSGTGCSVFVDEEGGRVDLHGGDRPAVARRRTLCLRPIGLLEAAKRVWQESGRPVDQLRFETFGNSGRFASQPFAVKIPRLGKVVEVPQNQTMLDALEAAGVGMIYDCRRGARRATPRAAAPPARRTPTTRCRGAVKASRRARSRWRASREMRLNTATGPRSRSARSRDHASMSSSTSSRMRAGYRPIKNLDIKIISGSPWRGGTHLGPRALPDLRRRAGPPVRGPRLPDRGRVPAPGRGPRLRPGQPHRPARGPLARGRGDRPRLQPRDDRAARRDVPGIGFDVADLRAWQPPEPVDVLVSNATLQWVPDHLDLLPSSSAAVAPGGWFAFQVPGNFGEPSHTIRTELAAEPAYAAHTAGVAVPDSHDPATYFDALAGCGLHGRRLGDDVPARPQRARPGVHLGVRHRRPADAPGAAAGPAGGLRGRVPGPAVGGVPDRADGVVLPFRRVFVVARVGG